MQKYLYSIGDTGDIDAPAAVRGFADSLKLGILMTTITAQEIQ